MSVVSGKKTAASNCNGPLTTDTMGFFDKLKEGLRKTTQILNTDIRDLFKSHGRLVDDLATSKHKYTGKNVIGTQKLGNKTVERSLDLNFCI